MNTYAGDMTAKQLWRTDPSMRPVSVLGIVAGTAGGDDLVVALAGGARSSAFIRPLEDRATIAGGIQALKAAGRYQGTSTFPVKLVQGSGDDEKLILAAKGRSLKDAAMKIRYAVVKAGLERAAFASRGLLILQNLSGFQKVRGIAAGIATVTGPIGAIIAAAMGAHGAVTAAVARNLLTRFEQDWKAGIPKVAASSASPMVPVSASAAAIPASAPSVSPWVPVLIGAGIIGGAILYRESR
jgi:hypothetical protein